MLVDFPSTRSGKYELKPQIGATGSAQAEHGTLIGSLYEPGGFRDMMIESFAGTHDFIGGQLPGFYGEDGNTKPGDKPLQTVITTTAIPVAAPFALADIISPDVMAVILKLGSN